MQVSVMKSLMLICHESALSDWMYSTCATHSRMNFWSTTGRRHQLHSLLQLARRCVGRRHLQMSTVLILHVAVARPCGRSHCVEHLVETVSCGSAQPAKMGRYTEMDLGANPNM